MVGSGVSGLEAPVGLEVSFGGLTFASFGVTPGDLSEPGAEGSTGFSANAGVAAKANIATATAAYFMGRPPWGLRRAPASRTELPGPRLFASRKDRSPSFWQKPNTCNCWVFQKGSPAGDTPWLGGRFEVCALLSTPSLKLAPTEFAPTRDPELADREFLNSCR